MNLIEALIFMILSGILLAVGHCLAGKCGTEMTRSSAVEFADYALHRSAASDFAVSISSPSLITLTTSNHSSLTVSG